jgi:hypothetical protein
MGLVDDRRLGDERQINRIPALQGYTDIDAFQLVTFTLRHATRRYGLATETLASQAELEGQSRQLALSEMSIDKDFLPS